jgi:hypothetical protein
MNRTEFGFERTNCSCKVCVTNCLVMPGFLIPADLERLIPPKEEAVTWAEENLLASPGALAMKNGMMFRIPTLVPATKANGECIHLTANRCDIHELAPFGCSFFDCGPDRGNLSMLGLMAVHDAFRDHTSLYHKLWVHLFRLGRTQKSPEELRRKMRGI